MEADATEAGVSCFFFRADGAPFDSAETDESGRADEPIKSSGRADAMSRCEHIRLF